MSSAWDAPDWQPAVEQWVRDALAPAVTVTGPLERHLVRAWSAVLRVPTGDGEHWFKALAPGSAYEPRLVALLTRWQVPAVLQPVAVDLDRAWLLTRDGGRRLREIVDGDRDLGHWERVLPAYAQLQRGLEDRPDELLATGLPDHRPERMPALLAELLDSADDLLLGRAGGMTPEVHQRLVGLQDEYAAWCAELAAAGVAASLQHDDLHDANVFVNDGACTFFDWGDASLGHPFTSLLVTLRTVADKLELRAGGPELRRLRDAYLEAWTDVADRRTLDRALELAVRTGTVGRSLSWLRAIGHLAPADRGEHAAAVPGWLEELLEPDVVL